ncbi:MAG TPA: TetR/AcrR family transcriptional regulator [Solirubrobacterales bacterium]|nr:TetR/AcrR family transcriptional regulator [Solirubrobacterales bacterium]
MTPRRYEMRARSQGVAETRRRIVDATNALLRKGWYDEISLKDIASEAGVAPQTVVNHFGTKDAIFAAVLEQEPEPEATRRLTATPDDIESAIALLVGDYEFAGDGIIRVLALEERIPALKPTLDWGRSVQRKWIEDTFPSALAGLEGTARERRFELLVCATDVYTWKLLRRDRGLSRKETAAAIRQLVEAAIATAADEKDRPPS